MAAKRSIRKAKSKTFIKSPKVLVYSALAVILTAVIGSFFTKIDQWYEDIKPAITPPNLVFPIVWTILFVLIGVSMYLSISQSSGKLRKQIIVLFAINLSLNVLWSILFFTMHLPLPALIELLFLWASIIVLISITLKSSRAAAWLLLPYALWVMFAGVLNYLIVGFA